MTKKDIADELCRRIPNLTKSTAIHAVEQVTEIFSEAFSRGENVYLRGFGTLMVRTAKEKIGRDISAGVAIVVPARRTVKFKISAYLKDRLNSDSYDARSSFPKQSNPKDNDD